MRCCCGFRRGFQGPRRSFSVPLLSGGVPSWLSVVCSKPLCCWWRGHNAKQKASWSSLCSSCGETEQNSSSKGISLSARPAGPHFSGCSHVLTGEQRMLWHLLTASPELCLVQHILPTAEPLAAPKICSASSQPGWLRPVCAPTALHSHNSELLQPQAEECRSTACLLPSLPRNNLEQLFLCNILKTCWY